MDATVKPVRDPALPGMNYCVKKHCLQYSTQVWDKRMEPYGRGYRKVKQQGT